MLLHYVSNVAFFLQSYSAQSQSLWRVDVYDILWGFVKNTHFQK